MAKTGARIIHQQENAGIAAALNAGISAARTDGDPDYVLTLDQDSRLNPLYVQNAIETLQRATSAGIDVGFVCASSYSGHAVPTMGTVGGFTKAFDPMQSGFMIPVGTIDRVGVFDAGLFIDGVDSEYTMRVRGTGLQVLVGEGCDIDHDLGQRDRARLLGRPLVVFGREISFNYHSPSRVYYICRNGAALTRRYALSAPGWTLRRLVEEGKAHVLRFAFSPGKRKLILAAMAGFADALRGRTGRIPADLEQRLK
ncbi:glycosyltransferase [Arthrobacter sp. MMS18-M83]|uniref:glycosyltransferase n=1 Tax=Arthrobacter sp. MMS18-M83 TaxID=2996261 RepID=UPI00227B882E|nr:glycosyltransferase [Arthrobacter sp. MMS18-M83]WAH96530.1 glycosyltransferase [Arthrobacter sp. MMS18-M83]